VRVNKYKGLLCLGVIKFWGSTILGFKNVLGLKQFLEQTFLGH
jgi:hypothetical protein